VTVRLETPSESHRGERQTRERSVSRWNSGNDEEEEQAQQAGSEQERREWPRASRTVQADSDGKGRLPCLPRSLGQAPLLSRACPLHRRVLRNRSPLPVAAATATPPCLGLAAVCDLHRVKIKLENKPPDVAGMLRSRRTPSIAPPRSPRSPHSRLAAPALQLHTNHDPA
jgi:hypothetical protein